MFGGSDSSISKTKQIINLTKNNKNKMKTTEQNQKEVMNYLANSSQHFFESEDGKHWQAIVKLHALDRYVLIKDGEVFELNLEFYLKEGTTAGKTFLKQKIHPVYDPSGSSFWTRGYGHGPSKKLRAVRWNNAARLELTSMAAQAYLEAQKEPAN
jgi:hypothetical protein